MTPKYVFDATPLIHLTKAGLSHCIVDLEGEKYAVPSVFDEIVTKGKESNYLDAAGTESLIREGTLKVKTLEKKKVDTLARLYNDIHAGELEVIALAEETNGTAIIDDRIARAIAKIQKVQVEGSYAVILRAVERGSMSKEEASSALGALIKSGWRCDAELYAVLLSSLKEL